MSETTQNYATHRRWHPLFHFIGFPILTINVLVRIALLVMDPSWLAAWNIVVAFALLITIFLVRLYALRVQNRVIRLEERLRMERVLPDDLRARIAELRTDQLIALRFCADAELPEVVRVVFDENLTTRKGIKQRIRNWRADWHRV